MEEKGRDIKKKEISKKEIGRAIRSLKDGKGLMKYRMRYGKYKAAEIEEWVKKDRAKV